MQCVTVRATAPFRLRRMKCQYQSLVIDYFISYLIPFQIWGSTLHWVLVLYKLWGSTCCPGCMAVAAYVSRAGRIIGYRVNSKRVIIANEQVATF